MTAQPSGTVSFLFTDIEGSTRLLAGLGAPRYSEALERHRQLLRSSFERHQGYEVDCEGDAFVMAFADAREAVAAAAEAQRSVAAHAWPEVAPLRVRIGIHTGEPLLAPPKYVGIDVHQAARIMAAAHGGQVLLSETTRELIGDSFDVRDLGEHRLKDIPEPVQIYQLGEERFPPLKTISNTNLPRPASSFVGRKRELEEVLAKVEQGARLLTLTGPGGSGKTRLALEAATALVPQYKAGIFWVGLAALGDPELVPEQISQTIGAMDGLAGYIGERELLLLLDNLEQVVECAPQLSALVQACPNLTLLCTSRELLRVQGEVEYPVPPLASPEAVSLFFERSGLEAADEIAELCARLDNLPLAVELAAARTKALTPAQILERLSKRLDLLKGGRDADPRQQTLRATIAWSYDLLTPDEQRLFARLSVYAGGCTLEAAEDVCDAELDTLQSLVEKSLIRSTDGRYWMLETIRDFAIERLSALPEHVDLCRRHGAYFLRMVECAEQELRGARQREWLERLDFEHDNLREALGWLREAAQDEDALRLAAGLWRFWRSRNHVVEGSRELEATLRVSGSASTGVRSRALIGASRLELDRGRLLESASLAREALVAARDSGLPREIARATENLGVALVVANRSSEGIALLEDSVTRFRELGARVEAADALNNVAQARVELDDAGEAEAAAREALVLQREAGNTLGVAFVLHTAGYVALKRGDLPLATARLQEGLVLFQQIGDYSGLGDCLEGLAQVAAARKEDRLATLLWAAGASMEHRPERSRAGDQRRESARPGSRQSGLDPGARLERLDYRGDQPPGQHSERSLGDRCPQWPRQPDGLACRSRSTS